MSAGGLRRNPDQRVELRIGRIRITGQSQLTARRLADALPAALEAALVDAGGGTGRTSAERAAAQIVAAIARQRGEPQ